MAKNRLYLGLLKPSGYLKTEFGEVLLTKIPVEATQSPESAILEIDTRDIGKIAIVKGELSGNVLYSAKILEIAPILTSNLMKSLIEKGIVNLEDFENQLSDLELKEVRKLCALVIGHKKSSPGAVNKNTGLTEFEFNDDLAIRIEKKVKTVDIQRVYRRTYKTLPQDINELDPDFIISLHCNAFNGKASGTEVLYYYKSEKGKQMAEILLRHLVECLKLPDRGIKPKTAEDRGGYLLRYTNAPCVISEPFFIDNDNDLLRAQENIEGLAEAYAKAIEEIAKVI